MLTIFSTPKPFRSHFGIIQMNAIQSWLRLHPECEIILFGNEEGTAEAAACFGVSHVPRVACNEWGTPLVSSLFGEAQKIANNHILSYVNADIILMNDFLKAVQRVPKGLFLMVGQRWNLEVDEPVNFDDSGWEASLRYAVTERGVLEKPDGLDYFVFPNGMFDDIPPLSIGRPGWDNWMIYRARFLGIPVIDATPSVKPIHQIHDYSHHPQGKNGVWKGPEAAANLQFLQRGSFAFTLGDATRMLDPGGLRMTLTRTHIKRRLDTLAILYSKRSVRAVSLRLFFSGVLALYSFYDWLAACRGSRVALAIFRKLLRLAINLSALR